MDSDDLKIIIGGGGLVAMIALATFLAPGSRLEISGNASTPSAEPIAASQAPAPAEQPAPPASETGVGQSVTLYFSPKDIGADCAKLAAVTRTGPTTQTPARTALELLLAGPSVSEQARGLATNIPAGVKIQSITLKSGLLAIDFNAALNQGMSGSCRVTAIRSQIEKTLGQFSTVKSVKIMVNGKTALQP